MPAGPAMKNRRASFPRSVGAYELILPIASGGMGTVYLARKRGPGGFEREVALKLTHSFLRDQSEFAAQLIEEAKIASRIVHPNVVQVLDVEDDVYGVFLVMQYVEGDTLGGLMQHALNQGQPVPADIAMRVLCDALTGLHAAHELKDADGQSLRIVHRDFTPQNILVGTDGVSRLTDFGVAKAATRAGGTRTGIVKGKTAYMSPEQVRALPLDRRCDVWSAGIIAWELFAGRRLRDMGSDPAALLLRIATEPVDRLSSARPDIPPAVDEAVAWALAHQRERRCPTAEQFRDRLLTAWGERGAPAAASDVADHVQVVAGDALTERRAQAANARKRMPSTSGVSEGYLDDGSADGEDPRLDPIDRSASGAGATEASLVSSTGQRAVGRRLWTLAVEAAIVGAALGVLILGAKRLMAPPLAPTSTLAAPASSPPSVPAAAATTSSGSTDVAPPASDGARGSSPPTAPSSSAATQARAGESTAPSAHGQVATPSPRRGGTHVRSKEAGITEPPLAKSPYE
jgi:eukaryotic-like serine/threonine-protein kinase